MQAQIIQYKKFSNSAKLLLDHLKQLPINKENYTKLKEVLPNWQTFGKTGKLTIQTWSEKNQSFKKNYIKDTSTVINWGCSPTLLADTPIGFTPYFFLNKTFPKFSNKKKFFSLMQNLGMDAFLPECSTDWSYVRNNIIDYHSTWVARKVLNGSGGDGIVLLNPSNLHEAPEDIHTYPLFTKYIKKKTEYRVHILLDADGVAHTYYQQKKILHSAMEELQNDAKAKLEAFAIRNLDHGWVYTSKFNDPVPVAVNQCVDRLCTMLKKKFKHLIFGAFDIIYNAEHKSAYLLEVNTAPGLSENSANFYAQCLKFIEDQYIHGVLSNEYVSTDENRKKYNLA